MTELDFLESDDKRTVTVPAKVNGQIVLTGHVFHGDTPAEQYCTISVQRPGMITKELMADLRQALVGLTGNEEIVANAEASIAA